MLTTFRTNLYGNVLVGNAIKEATQLTGERNRTEIALAGAAVSGDGGSCTLTVTAENTGSTSTADFSHMDVIVQLTQGNNPPRQLAYTGSALPSNGEWTKTLPAASDRFEPGIFNPGEPMVITAGLALPSPGDTSGELTVGMPNGSTATASFSVTTPCP